MGGFADRKRRRVLGYFFEKRSTNCHIRVTKLP